MREKINSPKFSINLKKTDILKILTESYKEKKSMKYSL